MKGFETLFASRGPSRFGVKVSASGAGAETWYFSAPLSGFRSTLLFSSGLRVYVCVCVCSFFFGGGQRREGGVIYIFTVNRSRFLALFDVRVFEKVILHVLRSSETWPRDLFPNILRYSKIGS